jgi:hypothetical protein
MYYCTFFCLFFFKTEAVTRYAESGFKLYNPLQMAPLKIWAPQRREGLLFKNPGSAPLLPLDKNNGLRLRRGEGQEALKAFSSVYAATLLI